MPRRRSNPSAPDVWAEVPGFGTVELSLSTVDPADALRSEVRPSTAQAREPQPAKPIDSAAFALRVRVDRAALALRDSIGEWDAVERLDGVRAMEILEDIARPAVPTPVADPRPRREWDDRDLLKRIGANPNRRQGMVCCPSHEDRSPSLSWRLSDDGRALLHCFAGCAFDEILAALR